MSWALFFEMTNTSVCVTVINVNGNIMQLTSTPTAAPVQAAPVASPPTATVVNTSHAQQSPPHSAQPTTLLVRLDSALHFAPF